MCELFKQSTLPKRLPDYSLVCGDTLSTLRLLPKRPIFDLVITSPPYNLGKSYERRHLEIESYLEGQRDIIKEIVCRLKPTGSLCWQIGNYIENGAIEPLDILIHPEFRKHDLYLRNRIVWRFGHGLHCRRRFSGRYEVVLWYTKSDRYIFNLDAVRIPAKYPRKRHYKGPKVGKYSGNINGKNPEDVWDIPNVKGNHCEKTQHPCQFPVGLAERLILALTDRDGFVCDPYSGVGSAGVAAAIHSRRFFGIDKQQSFLKTAKSRILNAEEGTAVYRPHNKPVYDANKSPLSIPRVRRTAKSSQIRRPA